MRELGFNKGNGCIFDQNFWNSRGGILRHDFWRGTQRKNEICIELTPLSLGPIVSENSFSTVGGHAVGDLLSRDTLVGGCSLYLYSPDKAKADVVLHIPLDL